jgi:hypothetical protein
MMSILLCFLNMFHLTDAAFLVPLFEVCDALSASSYTALLVSPCIYSHRLRIDSKYRVTRAREEECQGSPPLKLQRAVRKN